MPSVERDGVALAYERADGPRTPIVLVHGWCCDRSYLAPQFVHFSERGHTVVAIDLRGHGDSDKPAEGYTMQALADDVAWMCGALGLDRPVLVGHSMGGVVCFDLAARYPDMTSAIVMLDSPVVRPEASRAAMPAFLETLRGPDYLAALRAYFGDALFLPTDDSARKAAILASLDRTPQHVMTAVLEALHDYDPNEAAGKTLAPSLYIASDGRALSDMARFHALSPNMLTGQTVGSGHFVQLMVPEQVNAMLDRFLAVRPALAAG